LHGHKEEALAFAEVAVPKGYQVMAIDLPVECKPWEVLPLLNEVLDYLYMNWKYVSVRANSIGSWFSLLAFQGKVVKQALLVRPKVDLVVSDEVGREFINQHHCQVTFMADGEHWFHTAEQIVLLRTWEEKVLNPC